MDDLVKKSLVKATQRSDSSHEPTSYAIYNLHLAYMLENLDDHDIEGRHRKLVECYRKACGKGLFGCLNLNEWK